MQPPFKFKVISDCWVALHPEPLGVVQFIGGAFFGTSPNFSSPMIGLSLFDLSPIVSYHYLLQQVFSRGYTVAVLMLPMAFDHWVIAKQLLEKQQKLPTELTEEADKLGYLTRIYKEPQSYLWIGHSLGGKYITLLRFLSLERKGLRERDNSQSSFPVEEQPALLIAPCFQPPALISSYIRPTQAETRHLFLKIGLNSPMAMISFHQDFTAGNVTYQLGDVYWLHEQLTQNREKDLVICEEILGNHYQPIGYEEGDRELAELVVQFLDVLKGDNSEAVVGNTSGRVLYRQRGGASHLALKGPPLRATLLIPAVSNAQKWGEW